jgi:uncharacterized protein YkwD
MTMTRACSSLFGANRMYRVVLPVFLALMLPGCGHGSDAVSSGFGDASPKAQAAASAAQRKPAAAPTAALGGEPTVDRAAAAKSGTKVASLDQAPAGSYERAPTGALADRDYTQTALDAERARDLINGYRKEKGLKPVKLNGELTNAAKAHSKDLSKWDRISHFGSDGSNPWDRVKRSGYNARLAAENVGTGQSNIDEVFKGWQESPGHNKNLLLADAEHMGIALVQDPKTEFKTFWTLVLGTPM